MQEERGDHLERFLDRTLGSAFGGVITLLLLLGALAAILSGIDHASQYWDAQPETKVVSFLVTSFLLVSAFLFFFVPGPTMWVRILMLILSVGAIIAGSFEAPIALVAGTILWIIVWFWVLFLNKQAKWWLRLLLTAGSGILAYSFTILVGSSTFDQIERNARDGLVCDMSVGRALEWNAFDAVAIGDGESIWMSDRNGNKKLTLPSGSIVRGYSYDKYSGRQNGRIGVPWPVRACAFHNGTKYFGYIRGTDLYELDSSTVCSRFDCKNLRDATQQDPEICSRATLDSGTSLESQARCNEARNKVVSF